MRPIGFIENTFLLRRIKHELLLPLHWARFRLSSDEVRREALDEAMKCVSSPDFDLIIKNANAGKLVNRKLVMHNGLRVLPTAYHGYQFLARASIGKTVDEPQGERLFGDLLGQIAPDSTMLELGSFWSFYSLWFHSVVRGARNFMIEPDLRHLSIGRTNFEINGIRQRIHFTHAAIGSASRVVGKSRIVTVDEFCSQHGIKSLAILHADIQGAEGAMLDGAASMLRSHRIQYLFVSSHSNDLHRECVEKLISYGYTILADANLDQSYDGDGLILAAAPNLPPRPIRPITRRHTYRSSQAAENA